MPKILNKAAIRQYRKDGYFFPVEIMSTKDMAVLRAQLETFESKQGHPIEGSQRIKAHLLFKWIDDLMRYPVLVDAVEDLIGPNILCWNTAFWIKEAQTPAYVGWHQDLQYWGLDNDELVSVWIALSPATAESGCMSVMPGSHKQLLAHTETYHENNILTRGQEIEVVVDDTTTVAMPLQPGQASFHNVKSAHGSGPNNSKDRRIGISMHYIPTHTKQMLAEWDSAALVRGEDLYNHFVHTPIPVRDFDPEAVAFHKRASDTLRDIVYKDAQQTYQPTL
jgi:hypothetical protein